MYLWRLWIWWRTLILKELHCIIYVHLILKLTLSNQVMYLGLPVQKQMLDNVVNSEVVHLDNSFIRKRLSEQITFPSLDTGSKKQKFNENLGVTGGDLCLETASDRKLHSHTVRSQDYYNEYEEDTQISKYNIGRMSSIPRVSNAGQMPLTSLCEKLENKWYASPEGGRTTSSNIYCLGVLLFEVCRQVYDISSFFNAIFMHSLITLILQIKLCFYVWTYEVQMEICFCLYTNGNMNLWSTDGNMLSWLSSISVGLETYKFVFWFFTLLLMSS